MTIQTDPPATRTERPPIDYDWEAITRMPQFRQLRRRRTAFSVSTIAGVAGLFVGLMALQAFAPDLAATPLFGAVNLGFTLSMAFMLLCWALGMAYSAYSARVLTPLEERMTRRIEGGEDV